MNTKIIDSCYVTVRLPALSDDQSLYRQFGNQLVCGNNEALQEAERIISSETKNLPIEFATTLVDAGMCGDTPGNVVASVCASCGTDPDSFAVPSFAQIGQLASFFNKELARQRMVPIITKSGVYAISWERADWPTLMQPVFRFLRPDSRIHNGIHVMMPNLIFS